MENTEEGKLFVFIGEKIGVKEIIDDEAVMDAKYLATYKVLEKYCGDYQNDTIEFTVYDHYGRPAFEEYKTVMLYVVQVNGKYYHEKYMYDALYKTEDGRWAGTYDAREHDTVYYKNKSIKPIRIDFAEEVRFSTVGYKKREIRNNFPAPYYKIVDTAAIAVYGNYVPELFEYKKQGVLTARGLFGTPQEENIEPRDVVLEDVDILKISNKERRELIGVWNELLAAIEINNTQKIKALSLDSVICSVCEGFTSFAFYNDVEPIDTFITSAHTYFPNSEVWKVIKSGQYKIDVTSYLDRNPEHYQIPKGESLVIYAINFEMLFNDVYLKYMINHSFQFVKRNGVFKFYAMES